MASAQEFVTLARYAERAERYDEMAGFMKQRVLTGAPLDTEEREMFSAAYKGSLSQRRIATRVATMMEQKEYGREKELAEGYRTKVSAELQQVCKEAIDILTSNLVPSAEPGEVRVFYLKMKGDYYRYLAEFAVEPERTQAAQEANVAYHEATNDAYSSLSPTNTVRLGVALNYSVFQHEVWGDTATAIALAKGAYQAALGAGDENLKEEVQVTLQLMADNLRLWEQPQ